MIKAAFSGSSSIAALALIGAGLAFAPAAFAQTAPTTAPATIATTPGDVETEANAIVVTGSRIRLPNASSPIPITSIAGDSFSEQARNSIGDALNDLPQLSSSFSQQNPGAGVGIAGLNLLDLRGLGTVRTLVLVNGRRHVGADILNNAVSVDVNTIPAIMIDRVDIVTGGNSAVYGSDAIAGVVNFVLKRNYNGFEIRGNTGVATPGFGGNQTVSAIAGKNFGGGRGNITVAAEYSRADRVFQSNLPWLRRNDNFIVVDVDPPANATNGIVNGSDGFADRTFFRDIRLTQASPFGTVPINQQPLVAGCGTGIASTAGAPGTVGSGGGANGVPYSCNYIFTDTGRLVFQTGQKVSTGINATYIGGNGQTGREGNLASVLPFNERYNFNLLAHYEVTPALDFFVEAKWGRTTSLGNASGPTFFTGIQSQFDSREKPRLDNPFLAAADRTTLANLILASGCNPSFTSACANGGNLSATDLTNIASGAYRFSLGKQLLDLGVRDELAKRTTWRIVGGIKGSFWDDWNYEISGNYGKMSETIDKRGYADKQRFMLSMDAGLNTATGTIQCRSQFDPAAATPYKSFTQDRLAADIAACVPYNPFGQTTNNQAAIKYFQYFQHDIAHMEQLDISGFVSGSTKSFFNLPGGPIRFALGAEYRSERDSYIEDEFADAGRTNALAGLGFVPAPFKVKEGYGELNVPILKDVPFFKELSLNGAARLSDYNSGAGRIWTYNYGGTWAPSRDIRFRAEYGRSVRAPNVSETAGGLTPNFANGFRDPCKAATIGTGTQYRAANCATDLGALLNVSSFANAPDNSLPVLSGSNPALGAERSDSWTFGTVITPRYLPNFTLSVDYYNIKVNGVITSASAQQIANSCYDLATLANPFCALFTRYRGTAAGPFGEITGAILGNSLIQAPLNYAKRVRRGIDTQLNYRQPLGTDVSLTTNLIYTHVFQSSNFINPTDPNFEDRLLSELGTPSNEFVLNADLKVHEFTFGYKMHYLGPMYLNNYEDFNALQGRPPQNADYADVQKYPGVFYHSIRFQWDVKNTEGFGKSLQFYTGVDNLLDKHPPLGLTGIGAGSAIYDFRGRSYYAGFRARF